MGIQDRDYARERRYQDARSAASARRSWIVVGVVILAIVVALSLLDRRDAQRGPPTPARPAVVDVNQATRDQLSALPYISDEVAQAIIDGRPYSSADDLLRVKGIGPKILERLRPHVRVGDSTPQSLSQRPGRTPQERRAP